MWKPSMSMKSKRPACKSPEEASASSGKKRRRKTSSCLSEDEDSKGFSKRGGGNTIDLPPMSKIYNSSYRNNKPAELFRKDLISAMKLPDSDQLAPEEYWLMSDAWKQEWERGVQVPVNPNTLPEPTYRVIETEKLEEFKLPKKFLKHAQDENFNTEWHIVSAASTVADKACRYDLDDLDTSWLRLFNDERDDLGLAPVEEITMELVMDELESQCFENLQDAIKSQEGLGIEYDEDVICDVCRSPDSEDGNEMVFCDSCNICVHQACYGITSIPDGSWVCRTCALGIRPLCELCPHKGGAMKSTRSGSKWAHVSCALWVPEVSIGCVEKMEPITKISHIPQSRWSLLCTLCKERVGACIQCSVKTCKTAYHVTCAFKNGLEMKAIIDEDNEDDGVKLRSYCEKHSKKEEILTTESDGDIKVAPKKNERRRISVKKENTNKSSVSNNINNNNNNNNNSIITTSGSNGCDNKAWMELEISTDDRAGARDKRIQLVEAEFYKHVSAKSVSETLQTDAFVTDCIYQYWKLKRRTNFNKPLLTPKAEESNLLCRQQEDSLYARMKMFVHLRQDLERVRNLCYMVNRREKLNRSYFRVREEVFKKQVAIFSKKGAKFSDKERNAIAQANHSDNIYDRLYSCDTEKFPLFSSVVSVLEGKDCPSSDLTPQKRQVKKPEKVVVPTPEKIQQEAQKTPNPYAKHYFNGIRRSHRKFTSLFQLTAEDGNGDSNANKNKCRIKQRFKKMTDRFEAEMNKFNEMRDDDSRSSPPLQLEESSNDYSNHYEPERDEDEPGEPKQSCSSLMMDEDTLLPDMKTEEDISETLETTTDKSHEEDVEEKVDTVVEEKEKEKGEERNPQSQELSSYQRKVLQAKGSNISYRDQVFVDCDDVKLNSEVKVSMSSSDIIVLKTEGKENDKRIVTTIASGNLVLDGDKTVVVVDEATTTLTQEESNYEVPLTLNGGEIDRDDAINKDSDNVFIDTETDDGGDNQLVLSPRRLRSSKASSRSSSASSSVKTDNNNTMSKRFLKKQPTTTKDNNNRSRERIRIRDRDRSPQIPISVVTNTKSSPTRVLLDDTTDGDRKKVLEESIKVRESLFPATSPRSSLAGYRIPKKKSESSDTENLKDRGNSPISPLSDIGSKKPPDCGSYNLKPVRHQVPTSPVAKNPWNENHTTQSPRLVIKLRKDPDSPRWRSDSYNYAAEKDNFKDSTVTPKFHVINNDWEATSTTNKNRRDDGVTPPSKDNCDNGSRYPIRFRTISQKPNQAAEMAS